MKVLVPLLLGLLFVAAPPLPEGGESPCGAPDNRAEAWRPPDYGTWSELLRRAVTHRSSDKEFIARIATNPPSAQTGDLARVLLKEWTLDLTDEQVRQPRRVFTPRADFSKLDKQKRMRPWAFVKGVICEDGFMANPVLLRTSENPEWDQVCLADFSQIRFRPARDGDHYVPRGFVLGCEALLK